MPIFMDRHDMLGADERYVLDGHRKDLEIQGKFGSGIHAGEPVAEHNDLFGATVQLAARLCSEAEVDGITVSGLVRELCDEDTARFVALGQRRLKGFAEKVPVYRFEWRG
jgi:class 3 adenylate cyclase